MKPLTYILIIFLLASCKKQEIISTTTRTGKVYGYSKANFMDTSIANFNSINYKTGNHNTSQTWQKVSAWSTQAMYAPQNLYAVTAPLNEIDGINNGKIYTRNIKTNTDKIYYTQTKKSTVALCYSPSNQGNYAVQQDTLIQFTFDDANSQINTTNKYPGVQVGNDDYVTSSTAHGYLPYIFIAGHKTIRRFDVSTNTYTSIPGTLGGDYFGIRYNHHDSLVYVLYSSNGSVKLYSINPTTNAIDEVVNLPNDVTSINSENYTATIHCCDNVYILFQNNEFFNVDMNSKQISRVPSPDKVFQGLIWTND